MDPIATFSGLASGIQWQDMIEQIMKLEAARSVDPLKSRYGRQNARIDAWKTYEGLVSKLRSASISLRDGSSFGIYNATAGLSPAGRALISDFGEGASPAQEEDAAPARAHEIGKHAQLIRRERARFDAAEHDRAIAEELSAGRRKASGELLGTIDVEPQELVFGGALQHGGRVVERGDLGADGGQRLLRVDPLPQLLVQAGVVDGDGTADGLGLGHDVPDGVREASDP